MYSIKSNRAKKTKGIRFRLTIVYSTLFGLFLCFFALILTSQYLQIASDDFDKALLNYAIDLSNEIDFGKEKPVVRIPIREEKKLFPFIVNQTFFAVRSIEGRYLVKSPNQFSLTEIPYKKDLALKEDYTHRFQTIEQDGDIFRAVNLKMSSNSGEPVILQVGTSASILRDQETRYKIVNVITIPLLILISSIISYLLSGNAIAPIQSMTDAANNIAAKNLSLRVPVADTQDEVSELGKTLNTLLERLEKAFTAQENFVANASHQLNTPLSIIKGELDVLESKTRSLDDVNRFHKSLREELERLIDLVKNMLLISRVEAEQEKFSFLPLRIDELLLSVSARLAPKAREKKMNLRFNMDEDLHDDAEVLGEKQLLTAMFENILDNAIKYGPLDSTVKIEIGSMGGILEVRIEDQGPGVPEIEMSKILTSRFQRGTNIMPGTGIGLSIAQQIAAYHNAKISYRQLQPQGSLFIVAFTK